MIVCKCLVSGRVQGVFYRATVARRARELGLTGHARNLRDGRVEVLACGPEDVIQSFVAWLWIGSPASKATGVAVEELALEADQRPGGFTTG